MHILKTDFNGTPNVGLYGFATDTYVLLGESLSDKLLKKVQEVLGDIPVYHTKIAGTNMPGVFLAGNANAVLAPGIMFQNEKDALKKLGIPLRVIDTQQTCLGNNIVCNDHGAIISTEFTEKERTRIEKLLGVPTAQSDIAGLHTPGAVIVANNEKGIIHRDATDEEVTLVEKTLNITLEPATVNLGTPYLHAAVLQNSHGFVIGDACGGPEIVHVDDALGYMEDA